MKKQLLMLTTAIMLLSSCGGNSSTSKDSSSSSDTTPTVQHIHNFNLKVVEDKYLVSEATCEQGAVYYYSCECGEAGTETFVYGTPSHNLTKHDAVEATCIKEGNTEYYQCSKCDKYFSDSYGTNEIEEGSWVTPKGEHSYGEYTFDETSSYPDFKLTSTCSVCGESVSKNITGYDLTEHDFGNKVTLLDSNYSKTETVIENKVDDVEKGLVYELSNYSSDETFVNELPKINYLDFAQVEFSFKVYNTVNRDNGGSGFVCFGINQQHPEWLISTADMVYPTISLKFVNVEGVVTAHLTGAFDGNSHEVTLSDAQARGEEAFKTFIKVHDGYRNVILTNPVVRQKYVYSDEEKHGCSVTFGESVVEPSYTPWTYEVDKSKLRFDLSDTGANTAEYLTINFPKFDYSTYTSIYFPIYLEQANQSTTNNNMLFSFDGENYFITDTASSTTGYLLFTKVEEGFEVSYIYNGAVLGTTLLTDEDVISGTSSFVMYGKANVNWRIFSIGLPEEGTIKLSYDFSASTYGSKVYWDGKTVEPQQTTAFGPNQNKLRFDLSDTGANEVDSFFIDLPKLKLSDYDELYLPVYVECGCESSSSSNLIFSFDNYDYFEADTVAGQTNYIQFKRSGNTYTASYILAGTVEKEMTITDQEIIEGKKSLTMYCCAGVNWRRFSFLEPVTEISTDQPATITGNTNEWWHSRGYATFLAPELSSYPGGEYRTTEGCVLTLTRGGTSYNLAPSVGRSPINHNEGDKNLWFFETLSNWHMFASETGLTGYQEGDLITVKGTFASATDATKTVEFDFQLEWHNPTTIIK